MAIQKSILEAVGSVALAAKGISDVREDKAEAEQKQKDIASKKAQKQKAPLGALGNSSDDRTVINPLHAARIRVLGRRSGSLLHSYPVPTWWWCGCRRPRGSLAPRAGGRAGRAP